MIAGMRIGRIAVKHRAGNIQTCCCPGNIVSISGSAHGKKETTVYHVFIHFAGNKRFHF